MRLQAELYEAVEVSETNETSSYATILDDFPEDGVYVVKVSPTFDKTKPSAIFHVGRRGHSDVANVLRMLSVRGVSNSQLRIKWLENEKPSIYFSPSPVDSKPASKFDHGKTAYNIEVL